MREGGGGITEGTGVDADACASLLGPVGTSIEVAILAADLDSSDAASALLFATFSGSTISSTFSELRETSASVASCLTEA